MANTLENCTENVIKNRNDIIAEENAIDSKQKDILVNTEAPKEREPTLNSFKELEQYYLLQVEGDLKFRLTAKSARKNGIKAEFIPAGWIYQNKKDAEEVANRWTEGKRKIKVVPWFDPRLDAIWFGSKEEAKLAKKSIKLEIESDQLNKKRQEITLQCYQSLHPLWLRENDVSKLEAAGLSEKEIEAYKYFKPFWDKTSEEQGDIDLKGADIIREEEDLKDSNTTEIGLEVVIGGIPKKVTDMQSLDKRFAQLEAPGQPCVIINRLDAQPISSPDFSRRLSGEVVRVDSDGQPKYIPASKFWEGNSRKCIYKNIVFTNQPVRNDTYNLFTGFGVKPHEGNCDKIFAHIKDVICAGNEDNNAAFIKLLAWQIQNIGKPSRIIVALKSKVQQVGKGCLLADILAPIYGNSGFVTSDLGQIITRFNDTIRGKAYIFLDEALFSGDRKAADAVKSLATTTRQGVESKGIPTVQFPIAVNLFLATNHDDAAHVEEADARYWILEASPHRAGKTEYFKELYVEIEGGGREAFMHYLLSLDVSDFIPSRDVPKDNEFKEAMIRNSINPFDARKWLEECCRAEMILGLKQNEPSIPYEKSNLPWVSWKAGEEHENGLFPVAYTEWQKTVRSPVAAKPTPSNKFGELLNKAGLEQRNQGGRLRKLPAASECLKTLERMIEKVGK